MIYAFLKKGSFQDSVSLMLISRKLSESKVVDDVSVMMGTPANKSLLEATGFWDDQFHEATPNDICIAIKTGTEDATIITTIAEALDQELANLAQNQGSGKRLAKARRFESAQQKLPDANVVLISIAGEYAAELAEKAVDHGKNVMIFSDNVTLEDEIRIKQKAATNNLIVMGPDCGTAMLSGVPLAFANVLPKGVIGVVGASGTGIQELCSQIALLNQGITHAIGLGGRDLSAAVGGVSALSALKMLADDPESKVIAFVSKPPAPEVRQKVLAAMKAINKPVVALFLGATHEKAREDNVYLANTLDQAARIAAQLACVAEYAATAPAVPNQKIAGLYTGGTLAAEIAMLLADELGLETDSQHNKGMMLHADGHQVIDLGDDFYTVGRPHPMIDPTTRQQEIMKLATQKEVGILLVDLVIGYGAEKDPATSLANAVTQMQAARAGHPIVVIATVTGTEQDPQNRSAQIKILQDANIIVVDNLPEAAVLARTLITPQPVRPFVEKHGLLQSVKVINAGLRSFAEDMQASGVPVVHYQWAPIAGGNPILINLLKKLK